MWISNGKYSDVAIVFAQTDKSLEKKYKGIVAFIVDTKSKGYTANDREYLRSLGISAKGLPKEEEDGTYGGDSNGLNIQRSRGFSRFQAAISG